MPCFVRLTMETFFSGGGKEGLHQQADDESNQEQDASRNGQRLPALELNHGAVLNALTTTVQPTAAPAAEAVTLALLPGVHWIGCVP
jgi:hypothetical protein